MKTVDLKEGYSNVHGCPVTGSDSPAWPNNFEKLKLNLYYIIIGQFCGRYVVVTPSNLVEIKSILNWYWEPGQMKLSNVQWYLV